MRLCFAAHGFLLSEGASGFQLLTCFRCIGRVLLQTSGSWQASSSARASDTLRHHALDTGEPIRAMGGRGYASSDISVVWARLAWAASAGGESFVCTQKIS